MADTARGLARRLRPRPLDLLLLAALVVLTYPVWSPILWPPPPPFRYTNIPFPLAATRVHAGDTLEIVVSYCNDAPADLTYLLDRTVRNADTGESYPLVTLAATVAPGCRTVTSRAHVVPVRIPAGRYLLATVASVNENGRAWAVPGRSDVFEVVGGGG